MDGRSVLIFAHVHRYVSDWVMLSRFQRLPITWLFVRRIAWRLVWHVIRRRRLITRLFVRHLIAGRAVTVAGAERLLWTVLRSAVAVIVQVDVAEVRVRLGIRAAALVPGARRTVHQVRVAVGTHHDRSIVVEVESVVTARPWTPQRQTISRSARSQGSRVWLSI